MANRHFGKIGDVWKHLPLAQILALEEPREFWESHAGSAKYAPTDSWMIGYGVRHFHENASRDPELAKSAYARVLKLIPKAPGAVGSLPGYPLAFIPGSPWIAMRAMGSRCRYVFCDVDKESLADIRKSAPEAGVAAGQLECVPSDGVAALAARASAMTDEDLKRVVVHLDPYMPFTDAGSGLTTMDLFCDLVRRGAKAVLWYGYDGQATRDERRDVVKTYWKLYDMRTAPPVWFGDVGLSSKETRDFAIVPGVRGCVILCGNLAEGTLRACEALGRGLEGIYAGTKFPQGESGALRFEAGVL